MQQQFNLEEWQSGKKVTTRDGQEIQSLAYYADAGITQRLIGWVDGVAHAWFQNGNLNESPNSLEFHPLDLIMKETEMFVNYYKSNTINIVPYNSVKEAIAASKTTDNKTNYLGTYKLVKVEDQHA